MESGVSVTVYKERCLGKCLLELIHGLCGGGIPGRRLGTFLEDILLEDQGPRHCGGCPLLRGAGRSGCVAWKAVRKAGSRISSLGTQDLSSGPYPSQSTRYSRWPARRQESKIYCTSNTAPSSRIIGRALSCRGIIALLAVHCPLKVVMCIVPDPPNLLEPVIY